MMFSPKGIEQLKILFVLPGYEPAWALGGVITATSLLARALVSVNHQVTVYTTTSDGRGGRLHVPAAKAVNIGGVHVHYFEPTWKTGTLFDSRDLIRKLRETVKQFDIVYIAATYQWIGIEAAHIARSNGIPSIVFLSGTLDKIRFNNKWLKKRIWYELFLKHALDCSSALHLAGPYEQEQSWKYVKQWSHFLAPHCINLDRYRSLSLSKDHYRQQYSIPDDTPILLASGRIDPLKRLDILINALYKLKGSYPFQLLIAGDADSALGVQYQNLVAQLGLSSQVQWMGLVPFDSMPEFYAAGDIFVHLSIDENFGLVVAEAMACGLPILVTPGVGIWHSLDNADVGRCVPLDVNAVADTIVSFFENRELWYEKGTRAHNTVQKLFAPVEVANRMTQAFSDVIQGNFSSNCNWYLPKKK